MKLKALLPNALLRDRLATERWLKRNKGGRRSADDSLTRWVTRLETSVARREKRLASLPEWSFPPELPISARADDIIQAIKDNSVVVVAGETGSGKTTQLPKMCLAAGFGVDGSIACTQPRRVAALSVSRRIAEELKVEWGEQVGAKIRFTDRTSSDTLIKMMTDGMLLAEVQADPELSDYEVVLIDEAHERSLNIDFLLGYLHRLRKKRPDLRIIITSATIDTESFSKAFSGAPIIEVSGRTYPVDVQYRALENLSDTYRDYNYIDGALETLDEILAHNTPGDVLVFLPGERDIREMTKVLGGRTLGRCEVLPLFGRLSNEEQQRIFSPTQKRKIILSTNIAETSLTIPGIRYVIDAGLARISHYHSRTHTRRLPIEPIAQSSANQRAGRAGRMEAGVCFRLYSEKDYASRPEFSKPELLRSNLAEVILRMKAFRLGEVEEFPFIDPPRPAAIRSGYELLEDLGALDQTHELTPLGRELAKLPCDPTVGRMLLQARKEGCLREILVIAAGLSIQDPRERPADAQEAADLMHARFKNPESDFLSLLKIWESFHEKMEEMTQSKLRKFCREHFLSYLRMREWRDVYSQLKQVMAVLPDFRLNQGPSEYDQIHRAILSGLLANVAHREAGNHYRATHQRAVMLHPGSGLFDKSAAKQERKQFKGKQRPTAASGKRTPAWVVCAEWMETNRLYARLVARIECEWLEQLGEHVVSVSYAEPTYSENEERAVVRERRFLYGLEVSTRRVNFHRIDPEAARLIFIREGLVAGTLRTHLEWYEVNQTVRADVEEQQTRLRAAGLWRLDERLERFYVDRLPDVGSVIDLRKWWKSASAEERARLELTAEDLLNSTVDDVESFPEEMEVDGTKLSLKYSYKPGEDYDGATLRVPFGSFAGLQAEHLDWAVPGYINERIEYLLKGLPKETRVKLHPLAEKAELLSAKVEVGKGTLEEQLTRLIETLFGLRIWPDEWRGESVPAHLRPRIEVIDDEARVVAQGRDWESVAEMVHEARLEAPDENAAKLRAKLWLRATQSFDRPEIVDWSFGDLEASFSIGDIAGVPVMAYPGLKTEVEGGISLRIFQTSEEAQEATIEGYPALLERVLGKELAWTSKAVRKELQRLKLSLVGFLPFPTVERGADQQMRFLLREGISVSTLREADFRKLVEEKTGILRRWAPQFVDQLERLLELRGELRRTDDVNDICAEALARLLPIDFLQATPSERYWDLDRYLEGSLIRLKKARLDPVKDTERSKVVKGYEEALATVNSPSLSRVAFRWAIEDFRIAQFAQKLGSPRKISGRILDELWSELSSVSRSKAVGVRIAVSAPSQETVRDGLTKKPAPKKRPSASDLESLKRLFNQ